MGASIEYARTAIRIPGMKEELFLLNAEMGESNVIDSAGRRARGWGSYWFGTALECMQRVALLAGSCEGGSLQVGTGNTMRTIKPETYIANWRKTMSNAPYRGNIPLYARIPEQKAYSYSTETPDVMKAAAAKHAQQGLCVHDGNCWSYDLGKPAAASAVREVLKLAPHGWFHKSCLPQSVGWLAEIQEDDSVCAAAQAMAKPLDLVEIYRTGRDSFQNDTYLVVEKSGKVLSLGCKWSIVSSLLTRYAYEVEATTGATESQIRAWRRLMEKAAPVSGTLLLPTGNVEDYQVSELAKLGAIIEDGNYRVALEKVRDSWMHVAPEQDARVKLNTTAGLFAEVA